MLVYNDPPANPPMQCLGKNGKLRFALRLSEMPSIGKTDARLCTRRARSP
jgi:hypothetical protein